MPTRVILEPAEAASGGAAPEAAAALPEAARGSGLRVEGLAAQRAVAADTARSLDERLEAFEDIFDSEVGDTSLVRARNLERESGLRQIYVKFEGGNPTGTQKDRIAFAQARDALRRGYEAITVATCGNYGAALALAAAMGGLACRVFIPRAYTARRIDEMEALGARIERVEGDYETAVAASRRAAESGEIYDANPGGSNVALQLDAYAEIAYEIYDELADAPAVLAAPVSNGTTLAGIHKGFVRLYRRGKTSRIPRMAAGSASGKNPIVRAFLKGLPHCEDLEPGRIRETEVNEPLINWHAFDGEAALEALHGSRGWAGYASDREMLRQARLLKEAEGLSVLPASTAGLAVLLARRASEELPGDRYVAVLTGRR